MRIRFAAASVVFALLAAGCGDRPAPPQPGVFDSQLQAIDKAKAVEQTMQDQADERRKAIDEAERR